MAYTIFDIIVVGVVLLGNVYLWRKKPLEHLPWLLYLLWFAFFAFVFPYVSAEIEAYNFHQRHQGEVTDGFNTVYIFFRWPMYWVFGLMQLASLLLYRRMMRPGQTSRAT